MKAPARYACLLFLQSLLVPVTGNSQAVARVSQVLPFATSGTVTSAGGTVTAGEAPISASPGNASVQSNQLNIARAGEKITTSVDGATSLVLGDGAEEGTARLGPDSEVKVPDAGEKGHSLELLKGQLFLNISADQLKQRGGSEFKLKTPTALLAVKGTKFFSRLGSGKDIIGVHAGSVAVTEPTTGQMLTLVAGQAVDVSPGILGAMREMTAEEKQLAPEYDKARITRMICGVHDTKNQYFYQGEKVDIKAYPDLQYYHWPWLRWANAYVERNRGENLFSPKPQFSEQGAIRYVWKPRLQPNSDQPDVMNIWCFIHVPSKTGPEVKQVWNKLVAVEFQLRVLRVELMDMRLFFNDSFQSKRARADRITGPQLPSDGSWTHVTLILHEVFLDGQYSISPRIALEVVPHLSDKLSQDVTAVEMKDFVLILQP